MSRRRRAMHAQTSIALLGSVLVACSGVRRSPAVGPARLAQLGQLGQLAPGRVDSFQVAMPELGGRQRTVRVYLPAGYEGSGGGARAYPVLYLQDAQNLFVAGPYGDWLVDETMDRLVREGRSSGVIVVGIDNSRHRWEEYGPWVNRSMRDWVDSAWAQSMQGGEGSAYLAFLTNALKPEVDRRYRTLRGREHTGIGGSSMGGLIALHAGLTRPDVFSKVMAMSPAVWFAESGGGPWLSRNQLLAEMRGRALPRNVRFYVDVGTNERSRGADPGVADARGKPVTYPQAYVEGARAAVDALRAGGVPDANVKYVVDTGAVHHESAWARRLEGAVTWLYQ